MYSLKEKFKGKNVLIIGDIMLDSYIIGGVERISPEAPVPVVNIKKREDRLGGAANVALNIKALGANPLLCSVVGNDNEGRILLELMKESGISTEYIYASTFRNTTAKTRIMAQKHQLLRLDNENTFDLNQEENSIFQDLVVNAIPKCDVVIFEDYNKGLLTHFNIPYFIKICKEKQIPTAVDPKKKNFWEYEDVTIFKPNLKELKEALNWSEDINPLNESLDIAVEQMEGKLNNKISFITLSENGVFIKDKKESHRVPAHIRNISDVSGAGDTVISVAALCLANNFPLYHIAQISNLAGGLVCEEPGVVPINLEKLESELVKNIVPNAGK
jgi:D-glycero-beta-D-manno-heptose-7-phosphate kinase